MDEKALEMCMNCVHAYWDWDEYGSWVDDCKLGLDPLWDEEQESYECEGYKEVTE